MNKKMKRIAATILVLTTFSVESPMRLLKFVNFSEIAYASSDDDVSIEESYLDDLDISEENISFSEKKTDYTVKVDKDVESITVRAKAKDKDDEIKINTEDVSLDSSNTAEKEVELDKGRNLIRIKLVTEDYGLRIYNLVVNRGSADTSDDDDDDDGLYLNNLELSDGNLSFSPDETSYNVNVNSSVGEITVTAQPEDDDDEVKLNGITLYKDDDYKDTIQLRNGQNEVEIDLEDDQGNEKTYTLNINRGGTTEGDNLNEIEDNTQDPIYLSDIVLQDESIPLNFRPKVTSYAIDVDENTDNILLKAKPENDHVVKVNGTNTESPYVRRISLNKGKNVVTIKVNNSETYDKGDDDYEERVYTVTIYRGTSEGSAAQAQNTTSSQTNVSAEVKANQWVNLNGKWQYNDATGNSLKGKWFFDKNYGKEYYFNEDGAMATGWISYNGSWYYLDNSGAMRTGWIMDSNGKWYYLYSSGAMAANTIIDGYKIDVNGTWIG